MHVESGLPNSQKRMVDRVLSRVAEVDNAYGSETDIQNLFKDPPLLEDMTEQETGAVNYQPRRPKHHGVSNPLTVLPKYTGDFLNKLRENVYKNKTSETLQDFINPSDMPKYFPSVIPRDLTDDFYEFNRPYDGDGNQVLHEHDDRGWSQNESPEMSEDRPIRERDRRINPKYDTIKLKKLYRQADSVISNYFMQKADLEVSVGSSTPERTVAANFVRIAKKKLSDFEKSLIYTKAKGWRHPDSLGVYARLIKDESHIGKWTFRTGTKPYLTVFQAIPDKDITDTNRLYFRVGCNCPSWLFWGAQYHSIMDDFFVGGEIKILPKFTPPKKRDPMGRFLVCKHVLACIPFVKKYSLTKMKPKDVKEISKDPKITIKQVPGELGKVPKDLLFIADLPHIQEAVMDWKGMSSLRRKKFILGLKSPEEVSFMAHRFPDPAMTELAIMKFKEMARNPVFKKRAELFIQQIMYPSMKFEPEEQKLIKKPEIKKSPEEIPEKTRVFPTLEIPGTKKIPLKTPSYLETLKKYKNIKYSNGALNGSDQEFNLVKE